MTMITTKQVRFLLLLLLVGSAAFAEAAVIAPDRMIDWTTAGIPEGIPSSGWSQCGATISPYTGAATTINQAIANCGTNQYMKLGPGTFRLSGSIDFNGKSRVALRGSGANSTFLIFSGASDIPSCNTGASQLIGICGNTESWWSGAPVYQWTAGYGKGTNQITLSGTAGIKTVNDPNPTFIVLNQNDDGYTGYPAAGSSIDNGGYFVCADKYNISPVSGCSYDGPDGDPPSPFTHRWQQEIVLAASLNATTGVVTLLEPLQHPNWRSAQKPTALLIGPSVVNAGVENLSIDMSGLSSVGYAINFYGAYKGWVSGVRIMNGYNWQVGAMLSSHMQIQNNYFFNGTGPDPYGVRFSLTADNVFINNIFQKIRAPLVFDGPDNGSVIAYNFAVNNYYASDAMFGSFWDHSAGDDFHLWEGNVGAELAIDSSHGTHLNETSFRNFMTGWESCANGQCGAESGKGWGTGAMTYAGFNRFGNIIGNVLGTPGFTSDYETDVSGGNAAVYVMGCGNDATTPPIPPDPKTGSTAFRWGNYDVATNSVHWNASEVPSAISLYPNPVPMDNQLPPSLFLGSPPAWWGSTPWPAIGPEVTNGNVGYCSGTLNTPGHFSGVPALKNSQCTGTSLVAGWAGHVNAIPAMNCALNVLNMPPDGSGGALAFDADACYSAVPPTPVAPTIISQPQSQTVNVGQAATFSIVAGGTPLPTFQWKKNGANISGATSASYTTPATVMSDGGAVFSCVVTNSAGTITSGNATLNVFDPAAPLIPSDRRIDWSRAGVRNGIINRTTPCSTLSPGASAAQITAAIDSCTDGVVTLNEGTYNLAGNIRINKNNVTLRGAGPNKTILNLTTALSGTWGGGSLIWVGEDTWSGLFSGNIPVVSVTGANKDATTITVSDASGIEIGDLLFIDELNDGTWVATDCDYCSRESGARSVGQMVEVVAVNTTSKVVTLSDPLYTNFARTPQALIFSSGIVRKGVGVENLTLTQPAANTNDFGGALITMEGTANSWVKNVEIKNINAMGIQLMGTVHTEIRNSYFHNSVTGLYGNSHGYAIDYFRYNSAGLVENNMFDSVCPALSMAGPVTGIVYAYNYTRSVHFNNAGTTNWMGSDQNSHGSHPKFNLWESNIGHKILIDQTNGGSSYFTFLREYSTGHLGALDPGVIHAQAALMIYPGNYYMNVIGSVFGVKDVSMTYENTDDPGNYADGEKVIYGVAGGTVKGTLFRWGNYDYASQATHWDASEVPTSYGVSVPANHSIPTSFLHASRPSFWITPWGTPPWPAIGSDVTGGQDPMGYVNKLPAQLCYENTPKNADGTLRFDPDLCYSSSGGPNPTPTPTPTPTPVPPAPSDQSQVNIDFLPFKNVFNPTKETLLIRLSGSVSDVSLLVYDKTGREVRKLLVTSSGSVWDGRNEEREIVASGSYLVVLRKDTTVLKRKIVVIK